MTALTPLALQNANVLRYLADPDRVGCSPAGVAVAVGRDRSNVAKSLKALEAAGLIHHDLREGLTAAGVDQLAALDRANGVRAEAVAPVSGFATLRHSDIEPDPENARKAFDPEAIAELAATLASHGMLQKPTVWRREDGRHQLVMGERRWRAWGLLIEQGVWPADHTEPCLIETSEDRGRMEAALIENLQRVDLSHTEMGDGFAALGDRFHLSNKAIAERVGRTAEFVQQHRRLTQLDADDKARLQAGRLTLHDALRIVAKPTPKSLGPKLTLLLAEVVAAMKANPAKGENYYDGRTEVQPTAGEDTQLQELCKRRVLALKPCHYRDRRAYVGVDYEGRVLAEQLKGADLAAIASEAGLLYTLAADGKKKDLVPPAQPYLTSWLNGPFELSAAAQKKIDDEKADRAKERERGKKERERRAKALEGVQAVAEQVAGREILLPADDALVGLYKAEDFVFPLTGQGSRVVDAKGQSVLSIDWRLGENQERVAHLIALSLNLARGRLPKAAEAEILARLAEAAKPKSEKGAAKPNPLSARQLTPAAKQALGYEGAEDVLRAVERHPNNGLTGLESAVGMKLKSSAIARRLDGLHAAGLIEPARAGKITAAGRQALDILDRQTASPEPVAAIPCADPAPRVRGGALAEMLNDDFAQQIRRAAAESD